MEQPALVTTQVLEALSKLSETAIVKNDAELQRIVKHKIIQQLNKLTNGN